MELGNGYLHQGNCLQSGLSPHDKGESHYVAEPPILGLIPELGMTDRRRYHTQKVSTLPVAT